MLLCAIGASFSTVIVLFLSSYDIGIQDVSSFSWTCALKIANLATTSGNISAYMRTTSLGRHAAGSQSPHLRPVGIYARDGTPWVVLGTGISQSTAPFLTIVEF
jgi:hypothetical protein